LRLTGNQQKKTDQEKGIRNTTSGSVLVNAGAQFQYEFGCAAYFQSGTYDAILQIPQNDYFFKPHQLG
jgi:hypothetical protein